METQDYNRYMTICHRIRHTRRRFSSMDSKKLEILMTAIDLGSFSKASEVVGYW